MRPLPQFLFTLLGAVGTALLMFVVPEFVRSTRRSGAKVKVKSGKILAHFGLVVSYSVGVAVVGLSFTPTSWREAVGLGVAGQALIKAATSSVRDAYRP